MEQVSLSGDGHDDVSGALPRPFIDLVPLAILLADPDGCATWVNRAWTKLTGQAEHDWAGAGWLGVGDASARDVRREEILGAARSGAEHRSDWTVSADGHPRRILHVHAVPDLDSGRLVRIVVTAADVTHDRARSARLLDQATHDSLTGLFNRARFLEFVQHGLERRRRIATGGAAVLFVDVDHLKATNDEFGHAEGDRVLRDVAARIKAAVRPSDIVARYGGDEFTILCEDLADVTEAEAVADRIRAMSHGDPARDVSVGVAMTDDPERDPATIVAEADRAMYEAKRANDRHPRARPAASRLRIDTTRASAPRVVGGAQGEQRPGLPLVVVAAHEMRTPLATIGAIASTLRAFRGRLPDADIDAALDVIEHQTNGLVAMLDDILELGQRHNTARATTAVDVADVVSDALEAAPPPDDVSVEWTRRPAAPLVVAADRSRVTRALVNLLTNAYRYGGPHITIDARNGTADITVSVEDDGPGIPSALSDTMFAPFARGETGGSLPGGSGLGLALARDIAESFGGGLVHEPVEPHGTRLVLRLPAATPHGDPVADPSTTGATGGPGRSGG
jgi:diguanylate cyclase (GGDEF)-like protein